MFIVLFRLGQCLLSYSDWVSVNCPVQARLVLMFNSCSDYVSVSYPIQVPVSAAMSAGLMSCPTVAILSTLAEFPLPSVTTSSPNKPSLASKQPSMVSKTAAGQFLAQI